jgi:uncharacterized membrane protein YcjF (UPF0283 family)
VKRLLPYANFVERAGWFLISASCAAAIIQLIVRTFVQGGPLMTGLIGIAWVVIGWGVATAIREWGK